jgi:hypothetical protein
MCKEECSKVRTVEIYKKNKEKRRGRERRKYVYIYDIGKPALP